MNSEMNENYLDQIYETFHNDQMKLMQDLKSDKTSDPAKEMDTSKQISSINSIMFQILKLRNLKKKIALKINL